MEVCKIFCIPIRKYKLLNLSEKSGQVLGGFFWDPFSSGGFYIISLLR